MDDLILDADSLFSIADIIDGYCAKQRETINVYYAQIMALESEWEDDETFGSIMKEIDSLRSMTLDVLDELYNVYPKYFRRKAQEISERPVMKDGNTTVSYTSSNIPAASNGGSAGTSFYSGGYSGNNSITDAAVGRSNSVGATHGVKPLNAGTISNINRGHLLEFELKSYYQNCDFPHMVATKSPNSQLRHPETGEKLYEKFRFYADGELKYVEFQDENGLRYYYVDERGMPLAENSDGQYVVGKSIEEQIADDREKFEVKKQ